MSPEVHSNRKATRASDVFSLHVVMWEVRLESCRQKPRQQAGRGQGVFTVVGENSEDCSPDPSRHPGLGMSRRSGHDARPTPLVLDHPPRHPVPSGFRSGESGPRQADRGAPAEQPGSKTPPA
ncbi:unnamed protein product, partial [Hapterophycus canaliculatus]